MLSAPQLARTACRCWSFCCQIKPHDPVILFLHDIMRNSLMWVTIYDPFTSNHGIDNNWNRVKYPWIFILPLPFFFYVESHLCKPKSSIFSYNDCRHIMIQQTWTAESEVLHMKLHHRPLTLLQNPKITGYHEYSMSFRLVNRIWRFMFIHYQEQTQFGPM